MGERTLLLLAFATAAAVTLSYVSWYSPPVPSLSDFTSRSSQAPAKVTSPPALQKPNGTSGTDLQVVISPMPPEQSNGVAQPVVMAHAATLEFRDLSYFVTLPNGQEKQLLNGTFGYARPGRLVALIGKSGAGE